jgi:hypothetical protein
MSLAGIRQGLVANLRSGYPDGVQIGKYVITSPTPPTLQIRLGPLNYHQAMNDGLNEFTIIVQGVTSRDDAGQMLIDGWAAVGGVKAAIESDPTLGGAVGNTVVRSMAEPVVATVGGVDVLLAEWSVTVYPEGDI